MGSSQLSIVKKAFEKAGLKPACLWLIRKPITYHHNGKSKDRKTNVQNYR